MLPTLGVTLGTSIILDQRPGRMQKGGLMEILGSDRILFVKSILVSD